jgi:hypothetical protein
MAMSRRSNIDVNHLKSFDDILKQTDKSMSSVIEGCYRKLGEVLAEPFSGFPSNVCENVIHQRLRLPYIAANQQYNGGIHK